jgi:nitrate/nitrite transporter NarK
MAVACLTWLFVVGAIVSDVFPAGNVASVFSISGTFGAVGAMVLNYGIGRLTTSRGNEHLFLLLGLLQPAAALLLSAFLNRSVRAGALRSPG